MKKVARWKKHIGLEEDFNSRVPKINPRLKLRLLRLKHDKKFLPLAFNVFEEKSLFTIYKVDGLK